ncbi:hypothetical protein [Nostoc sp.]|uniref:hypothetical protein n=1 Tax=Nostoc sp. TaxID=1180 RepID=UPI002FF59CFF
MSTTGYAYAPITIEMLSAIANGLKVLSNLKLDLIVSWGGQIIDFFKKSGISQN